MISLLLGINRQREGEANAAESSADVKWAKPTACTASSVYSYLETQLKLRGPLVRVSRRRLIVALLGQHRQRTPRVAMQGGVLQ